MLKNFEFKADEGSEKIKNQSRLNRELQNIFRVCMRKEQQADGTFKELDSVSPSCSARFRKIKEDKLKIHEGT